MAPISLETLRTYRHALNQARIPAHLQTYYLRWLNLYEAFCHQQAQSAHTQALLEAFVSDCAKSYPDWQCRQARSAVQLLAPLTEAAQPAAESQALAPLALEERLAAIAARVKCRIEHSVEEVIAIGLDLNQAKVLLTHGEFRSWLRAEFDMSYPTANRMMRAAECVSDKVLTVRTLSKKALYLLTAPHTPESVRHIVLQRLASGEKMSWQQIQALSDQIQNHRHAQAASLRALENELETWMTHTRSWLATATESAGASQVLLSLVNRLQAFGHELDAYLRGQREAA